MKNSIRTEHVIYNRYSHAMKVDPFGKYTGYIEGSVNVNQHINGDGIWQECYINNTGFGGIDVETARLFSSAWPVAIEIAERWNILRAGKHGSECPVLESETAPAPAAGQEAGAE